MTDALTIGWSDARRRGSRTLYRRVLGLNLILHLLIGLACIFLPYWVSDTVRPARTDPDRLGARMGSDADPRHRALCAGSDRSGTRRAPNLIGILGRLWMAIIWMFCGGGFLWFALFDFVFFLILAFLYLRFLQATLMSRP